MVSIEFKDLIYKKAPPFAGEGPFTAGTELTARSGAMIARGAIRLL